MSKARKKPTRRPGRPKVTVEGARKAYQEMWTRIHLGRQLLADVHEAADPDGLVLANFLTTLLAAGQDKDGGLPALIESLDRCGITDVEGLWRAVEAATSAASAAALAWAGDWTGSGEVGLPQMVECAAAWRPSSIDAYHRRMIDRELDRTMTPPDLEPEAEEDGESDTGQQA